MTTPAERVALIRSLTGHAAGREEYVLAQVRRVLDGATLDDLAVEHTRAARLEQQERVRRDIEELMGGPYGRRLPSNGRSTRVLGTGRT